MLTNVSMASMSILGRTLRLSESAKRNLFMAPGVILIFGAIAADACSSTKVRETAAAEESRVKLAVSASDCSMQCEASLGVE